MKIKEIEIKAVGGIRNLNLQLDESMSIICGPNGIGKTTILESIANIFCVFSTGEIRRNVGSEKGSVTVVIESEGVLQRQTIEVKEFIPEKSNSASGLYALSQKILSIKANRWFGYMPIDSVKRDLKKSDGDTSSEALKGIIISEVKGWFINRQMFSTQPESLTSEQLHNLEIAKISFSILNEKFSFSRIDGGTFDIMVNTPTGEIYFEYLSSGFKSCLSIIFGIIKDIEFRFKSPTIKVDEFDGVILIDEIELHLHPAWQGIIASALTKVFPKAQFVITTHSPHVIQNAKSNQIIALNSDNAGDVFQRELKNTKYGFQGWTIEEILLDTMGMESAKTEIYEKMISNFDNAIDCEDYLKAKEAYDELDLLLHPSNYLRKILAISLASISEEGK